MCGSKEEFLQRSERGLSTDSNGLILQCGQVWRLEWCWGRRGGWKVGWKVGGMKVECWITN
eukprot:8372641-Ditylum_brightwellii.AAC.1